MDIQQSSHVVYHGSHIERDPTFGNRGAADLLNQHLLIPGRVKGRHLEQFDLRAGGRDSLPQCSDLFDIFLFQGNHGSFGADMCRHRTDRLNDLIREGTHQILICFDQRLTFRAVHHKALRLGRQLYVRGEPGSAGPYHTRSLYRFDQIHTITILPH